MIMKVEVRDMDNKKIGTIDLPEQFDEPIRDDLISRAVLAIQSRLRQAYGSSPLAGLRHSTNLSRRRRDYRGSYGHGISRVPRKILSRNGRRMYWVGAQAPGTVGGRRAHGPKASKEWDQKINAKERRKALRAALAATIDANSVTKRGHRVPEGYPFVLDDAFESLAKTAEVVKVFKALGLSHEMERTAHKKVRAGRGKSRGRKYKAPVGPLLVVSGDCPISKAARNMAGVTIKRVNELSANELAPGCVPGRLTLFTKAAVEKIRNDKLYA